MKKIFLILVLAATTISFNSCSSDSDSDKVVGSFAFKVDGVQKTYSRIHLLEVEQTDYISLSMYTDSDATGNWVSFSLLKGNMADTTNLFKYYIEGDMEYERADNFSIHITSNGDDKKLIGTFSGDMTGPTGTITITDGTFNIQY